MRSHAKLLASIWSSAEWRVLSAAAQRLYMLVLSQPRLTLVGVLDYRPSRWAQYAADTTTGDVEAAVVELEGARFVAVDHDTDELLIRSFTRHDLTPGRLNVNLLKGVWSAWRQVESALLREQIIHNMPSHLWTDQRCTPPEDALNIRAQTCRSAPLERPVATADQTARSNDPTEPPLTSHLSIGISLPPPTEESAEHARWGKLMIAAAALLARADAEQRNDLRNPDAWLATAARAHYYRNRTDWLARLAEHPDLSSTQLANGAGRSASDLPETIAERRNAEMQRSAAIIAAAQGEPDVSANLAGIAAARQALHALDEAPPFGEEVGRA